MDEAEERRRSARLFFALEIEGHARAALAAWRDEALGGREELRLVPAAQLHVTLAFLGHRHEAEIAAIAEAGLSRVAGLAAPCVTPRAVVEVPRRHPRLLALDLGDPQGGARAVVEAVSAALAAARLHEPEARPFWPHLTLARVRGSRGRKSSAASAAAPAGSPRELELPRVTLFRSHLSRGGARYEALASRPLVPLR